MQRAKFILGVTIAVANLEGQLAEGFYIHKLFTTYPQNVYDLVTQWQTYFE